MKKMTNIWIPFSFNSFLWVPNKKMDPKITPANDSKSIPHLSARVACSMKLSITARKNISTNMSQADLQYVVMKFQKMKVRDTTEMIHNVLLTPNGGLGKMNWKTQNTISTDDNRGERNTSHSC